MQGQGTKPTPQAKTGAPGKKTFDGEYARGKTVSGIL